MSDIDDTQIQHIVQRVLNQVLGQPKPALSAVEGPRLLGGAPSPTPVPAVPAVQPTGRRVVALGADHGGYELKETLKAAISEQGFDVHDVGTHNKTAVDYPDYAHQVARLVSSGAAWRGIMIDGAGIGSCIVANKVPGIRAGMAYDYASAVNSREHNDTNVLTLGAGLIGVNLAKQIVKTWLSTDFGGERHVRRIEKITAVEKQYLK